MGTPATLEDDVRRRIRAVILWSFWSCLWLLVTVVFLLVPVSQWAGWDRARDDEAAWGGLATAGFTGAFAMAGLYRLRVLHRDPLQFATPPQRIKRRLPVIGVAAGKPLRRLAEAEATLDDLLRRLDESSVPSDWVDHARHAAVGTARELTALAAKLEAVERALAHAPPDERATLSAGLRRMRNQLNRGVESYGRLVAAAGRALAASTPAMSLDELVDATDHLAGLGQALRELGRTT